MNCLTESAWQRITTIVATPIAVGSKLAWSSVAEWVSQILCIQRNTLFDSGRSVAIGRAKITTGAIPMSETRNLMRMDKTAFSIVTLSDESDEVTYWLTKTPQERLQGVELMRRVVYGYEPSSTRLQRVLEIAELETD